MLEPDSIRFESALKRHRDTAISLKAELSQWACSRLARTQIETIERFTQSYTLSFPGIEDLKCPATRADMYQDCEYSEQFH